MIDLKTGMEKLKDEGRGLGNEAREKTAGYILAAFGLVAGLAWNDAIKAFIDYVYPASENSLVAKFIYAGIITAIVVFATLHISRLVKKDKN